MSKSLLAFFCFCLTASAQDAVPVSGHVLDPEGAVVFGATVEATDPVGRVVERTTSDTQGAFHLLLKPASYSFVIHSDTFQPVATNVREINGAVDDLDLQFGKLQNASEVLDVTEKVIEPSIERRDGEIFTKTLFSRDDQIFQTLGAGLNFGQHAGGGKSLEIRRFGFNLDHGGAGGGLRFMRDGVFINDISGGTRTATSDRLKG